VAWSPDGAILASGSADKTFKVWNVNTGESQSKLCGHSDAVRGVCFSPDGSKLVSCSDDRSVKIWNLITRECVSTWHSE
jgi:WD40 repeat protein